MPLRGRFLASVSRSAVSMPTPAPWLSSSVAYDERARSVTSRPSPWGVSMRRSVISGSTLLQRQRLEQLGPVVAHVTHQRRDRVGLERARRGRDEQAGVTAGTRVEPLGPPLALDHQRHPVVDLAELVG